MFWLVLSLLALTAAAAVVYAAKRRNPGPADHSETRIETEKPPTSRTVTRRVAVPTGEPFEAVSIVPGLAPCLAARELRDHRFLIGEEPTLPLPNCDSTDCSCRLRQYPDRRRDGLRADRRTGREEETDFQTTEARPDRRQDRQRRRTDATQKH